MEAACPKHPDVPALGSCQRCGTFFCAQDHLDVDGVAYCQPCGVRPDVDWIEAYRKTLLGKRDGFAWFMGFSSLFWIFITASLAAFERGPSQLLAFPALASTITAVLFFFGKPIARTLVLSTVFLWGAILVFYGNVIMLIPTGLLLIGFSVPLASTRNRLFFHLDVPRPKLRRDYERLADNRLARNAAALGVLGVLIPPVAIAALVIGIVAKRRVDPTAKPPVGQGAYAIAGIVLGAIGIVIGGLWLVVVTRR